MAKCKLYRLINNKTLNSIYNTIIPNGNTVYGVDNSYMIMYKSPTLKSTLITFLAQNNLQLSDDEVEILRCRICISIFISVNKSLVIEQLPNHLLKINTRDFNDIRSRLIHKTENFRKNDYINYLLDIIYDVLELDYPHFNILRDI